MLELDSNIHHSGWSHAVMLRGTLHTANDSMTVQSVASSHRFFNLVSNLLAKLTATGLLSKLTISHMNEHRVE